jgi:predicted AAA+ superfamily ATPase
MNNKQFVLQNLLLYRNILSDSIIKKLQFLWERNCPHYTYYELYSELLIKAEQLHLEGDLLKNYIIYLVSKDENLFSKTAEKSNGTIDTNSSLYQAALHDCKVLKNFLIRDLPTITGKDSIDLIHNFVPTVYSKATSNISPLYNHFATESTPLDVLVQELMTHYSCYSCGIMSDYTALRWNSSTGLTGIKNYDTIQLQDITGYEHQKETLLQNTLAFLNDKPANNILLIGSPGTGKSSSVKALLNEPIIKNLRLIEVSKLELKSLNQLMGILREYSQKFIIFLDDLSFEEFEIEYKYLKSIIDGGVERTPSNVLIYATSNRMHLIKETWDDRKGDSDDIHRFDTVNEKLSLSDRFGITLTYLSPNQVEYLIIVEQLAIKNKISLPLEQLQAAALRWERQHNGRSGRTGQQFINHLLSQK